MPEGTIAWDDLVRGELSFDLKGPEIAANLREADGRRVREVEDTRMFEFDGVKIAFVDVPTGPGVRFDHMLYHGYGVPPFYDSLLGKLIVHGDALNGGIIAMDETTCMVEAALHLMRFHDGESCGQCPPCREGALWIRRICRSVSRVAASAQVRAALTSTKTTVSPSSAIRSISPAGWRQRRARTGRPRTGRRSTPTPGSDVRGTSSRRRPRREFSREANPCRKSVA